MPRTRDQFLQMKDERMVSILDASLKLFSVYGMKVSIDAISEKAKCSHGIVYHYFKNSDEIYQKLLKSPQYLELINKINEKFEGSSYEKIEHLISILIDVSKDDITKVCFLNMLIKSREKNCLFDKIKVLIKDGQNSGKIIGGEPAQIVETLFCLLRGIYLPFLLEKHPNYQVPSLENVMQFLRKPLSF